MRHSNAVALSGFVFLLGAGCTDGSLEMPQLSGTLDRAAFPAAELVAASDDGLSVHAQPDADGRFRLDLTPGHVWTLRVLDMAVGGELSLAVPRRGHFDRGFDVEGGGEELLGVLRPARGLGALRLVAPAQASDCVDGRGSDGSACAVEEPLVACPDGPPRPMDDPSALLLGVGAIEDLPGVNRGVRYAVPSLVPVPVFWTCNPTPTSPT